MRQGDLLNERYKIIRQIGSGGMAIVYLARDIILERDVAIKALKREYVHDTEFTTRFDREAQAATSLNHPNIVSIYDVGEEDEILYMVMEYVDGMTLKEYIQRYSPIEIEDAIDIMKQIVSAIAHAHDNDIVHRDIKPQNILVNQYGEVKVTDFGIAMALSATSLTQTNSILGSVHYLSPEQARGGMATKKSDIYSIGILFYELLTGKLPFSGQSPVSIALKHLQNEIPSIRKYQPEIPQSVENIVLKSTAKDPFHRYPTIYELEDAIIHALDPDRLNEPPYEPPVEVGEETKAIPIITDDPYIGDDHQETIVNNPNATTKTYSSETPVENKGKPKKQKKQKKNRNKKKWWIYSSILFVLIAAAIVALFFIPGILQPKDVELPDVVGERAEDAKEILEELNLVVEEELVYSDDVEEGYVVSMDPSAGRTVKEESTVTLTVSEGKERIVMEDYVGRDIQQVTMILEELGFEEIIPVEKHSDRPAGEIINQLQPAPETEVVPSETRVIFEVSIGPELITLNNLTGMTEAEVREYLENNNLVFVKHEENSDTMEAGRVIRQSPASGAQLEEGANVDVYISVGPREIPPTSHRVTYTIPYTGDASQADSEDENGNEEPIPQTVRIYIGDVNNNIADVYEELTITEDTAVTFTLLIAHNDQAEYIITRDDETIVNEVISYEEGE